MLTKALNQGRVWLADLFLHTVSRRQRIHDAAMAKAYGLDPEEYSRIFPAQVTNTNISAGGGNMLRTLLATGLLASALGGGGLGAYWLTRERPAAVVPKAWDVIVERQKTTGEWEEVARSKLRP